MRKIFIGSILAALCAGLAPMSARAQGKTMPLDGICVVSMQRVVEESRMGKAATRSLEAEMQKSKESVEGLRAQVQKMREELRKQSMVLSPEALENKGLALQRKERELGVALGEMRREFLRRNNASVAKVMEQTNGALQEINRKQKCRFILERGEQFVAYASTRVEITDDLIKLLDQKK